MYEQTQSKVFFDLHTEGVGYLDRIRLVKPKKGESFMACTIAAMRGDSDDVNYTKFDCRVSGAEAKQWIDQLAPAVAEKKKVIVRFKIGDIYPELFTYENGDRRGETGVSIKGRLLKIRGAKVDGQPVTLPGNVSDSQSQAS